MQLFEKFTSTDMPEGFYWFNEPEEYRFSDGLELYTKEKTDFWQNTHYGFTSDNGHCLFKRIAGDFSVKTHVEFEPKNKYDQCGLMVRADENNWIKTSIEYENDDTSRLGSVVTNLGYSDWATQDIRSGYRDMSYQISKRGKDFLIEHSYDGSEWVQMRIAHLHTIGDTLDVGLYACSPIGKTFRCKFFFISISENNWFCDHS